MVYAGEAKLFGNIVSLGIIADGPLPLLIGVAFGILCLNPLPVA
jgi:hypothetical protein